VEDVFANGLPMYISKVCGSIAKSAGFFLRLSEKSLYKRYLFFKKIYLCAPFEKME
jgi:hypothetical protein